MAPLRTFAALILLATPIRGADGTADPTFSNDGKATVLWDEDGPSYAEASAVAPLADGSVVVGGTLIWDPPTGPINFDWVLAKLSKRGILDTTWGDGGRRRIAFDLVENGGDQLYGVFAEPDGAVLVLGSTWDGDFARPAMARLTPAGDPDPGFGDAGLLYLPQPWSNPQILFRKAARQRDGKLLLAGHCLRCPSNTTHSNPFALRLHPDGSPDTTFSFDGWAFVGGGTTDDLLSSVAATADGRVLLAYEADGDLRIARLNWMGGLDNTFGGGAGIITLDPGIGSYQSVALAVDPGTDETYVVLSGTVFDGEIAFVYRLSASGAHDLGYGEDSGALFALEEGIELTSAVLQGDGKLLVAGKMNAEGAQRGGFFLGRLDRDGQPDLSFDGNGVARYEFDRTTNGEDIALAIALSSGRPIVGGYALDAAGESDMAILRVENAFLFADGFEAGETLAWSLTAP